MILSIVIQERAVNAGAGDSVIDETKLRLRPLLELGAGDNLWRQQATKAISAK